MIAPYYDSGGVAIYHGNAVDVLRTMPADSINCCITSPPYWGLRDYGTASWEGGSSECGHVERMARGDTDRETPGGKGGSFRGGTIQFTDRCAKCGATRTDKQIGLEETPEEYVAVIVATFEEVHRVLRSDGTLWLNLGDSYSSQGGAHGGREDNQPGVGARRTHLAGGGDQAKRIPVNGLKPKDLIGIPWRVAFALQARGWWLRSDIIWAKPAPMPESVTDRPTRSHEYIFLLAKSERYYCDMAAIKEPSVADHGSGNGYKRESRLSFTDRNGARGSDEQWKPKGKNSTQDSQHSGRRMTENTAAARAAGGVHDSPFGETRNKRDVWTVNSEPFPGGHFATFPPALILPCVLAGSAPGGVILDPFMGAGTTALVAKANGRRAIGVELKAQYIDIAANRLGQDVLAFEEPATGDVADGLTREEMNA